MELATASTGHVHKELGFDPRIQPLTLTLGRSLVEWIFNYIQTKLLLLSKSMVTRALDWGSPLFDVLRIEI